MWKVKAPLPAPGRYRSSLLTLLIPHPLPLELYQQIADYDLDPTLNENYLCCSLHRERPEERYNFIDLMMELF